LVGNDTELVLCAVLLLVPTGCHEVPGAALSGQVADAEAGVVLPEAVVEFVGDADTYSSMSDSEGRFRLLGITPGEYKATATLAGFKTS